MHQALNKVVIVGGGTAGWITAALLMVDRQQAAKEGFQVTLIESPDISPIGVGEGSWPSMRSTLQKIGISETEFIRECSVSFKQGSRFVGWRSGGDEAYYHPFSLPQGYSDINLAPHWQAFSDQCSFADAVSVQGRLCDRALAPKQISTPEYAFNANYGYHLDSVKFSAFLQQHCINKLGIQHVLANVVAVQEDAHGYIASLRLQDAPDIDGDLFVDCTGFAALLIGSHYQVPLISKQDILFNDVALAAQVPYQQANAPIASATLATAQRYGWIWDIGLPARRGVGHVYSSAHCNEEQAERDLRSYIAASVGEQVASKLDVRKLKIHPGHRQKLWHKNCVAIGIAGGFIEPLEASALVLIELSAAMLSEQLPANRAVMDIVAQRFNEKFLAQWERIIEFLKLHYVLTQRSDSDYWRDHCDPATIPQRLQDLVALWGQQVPSHHDSSRIDDMFSPASFQYVYYGMGGRTQLATTRSQKPDEAAKAMEQFRENERKAELLLASLPTNRDLINKIITHGLPKI